MAGAAVSRMMRLLSVMPLYALIWIIGSLFWIVRLQVSSWQVRVSVLENRLAVVIVFPACVCMRRFGVLGVGGCDPLGIGGVRFEG